VNYITSLSRVRSSKVSLTNSPLLGADHPSHLSTTDNLVGNAACEEISSGVSSIFLCKCQLSISSRSS